MTKPEGVAAPLEPSPPDYRCAICGEMLIIGPCDETTIHFQPCAYAAAVSKNLQEELAALRTRWNFALKGEDEALRECRRLEKEIAALGRDTGEKL